jgi:hypothetical protein
MENGSPKFEAFKKDSTILMIVHNYNKDMNKSCSSIKCGAS